MIERTPTIHKKEISLNKKKLKSILDAKGLEYIQLHKKIERKFGLDLKYVSFMSLLDNRVTWKLLYAHAIVDALQIQYDDIFEIVDVNVEEKLEEKITWKEKYEKRKNYK